MSKQSPKTCLHCGRTEAQVPLVTWRYQGWKLRICADCMPAFIHEHASVMAQWQAAQEPQSLASGGCYGLR
jgi:hypothetical protein